MKEDYAVFSGMMDLAARTFGFRTGARLKADQYKEALDTVLAWSEHAIGESLPPKVRGIVRKNYPFRLFGPLIKHGGDLFCFMHRTIHDIVEASEEATGRRKLGSRKRCGDWCGLGREEGH